MGIPIGCDFLLLKEIFKPSLWWAYVGRKGKIAVAARRYLELKGGVGQGRKGGGGSGGDSHV